MDAGIVIGQRDFNSGLANQGGSANSNTFSVPCGISSDGKRLFVVDRSNNRVFIYNSMPTPNNASADIVIGQPNFTSILANQGVSAGANTLSRPFDVCFDGKRLFIAEVNNNRVLIFNSVPTSNNASANVVVGQPDFATTSAGTTASKFSGPTHVFSDGKKLFVSDSANNRVLIYNFIPTSNGASANVVIGQPNFNVSNASDLYGATSRTVGYCYRVITDGKRLFICDGTFYRVLVYNSVPTNNYTAADIVIGQPTFTASGGSASATKFGASPYYLISDNRRLFISTLGSNRVLFYNSIPTANNASAGMVIGQPDFTSALANQGGTTRTNTLSGPRGMVYDGKRLYVVDTGNNRILIYNIGDSSIKPGPQFDQGKAPRRQGLRGCKRQRSSG